MAFLHRTFTLGRRAENLGKYFAAYISYGMGLWFATQALIHMGVASGILPTKGLTLPLMSYGGSSMITMMIGIGLLFRVDRFIQLTERENYLVKQMDKYDSEFDRSSIRMKVSCDDI